MTPALSFMSSEALWSAAIPNIVHGCHGYFWLRLNGGRPCIGEINVPPGGGPDAYILWPGMAEEPLATVVADGWMFGPRVLSFEQCAETRKLLDIARGSSPGSREMDDQVTALLDAPDPGD